MAGGSNKEFHNAWESFTPRRRRKNRFYNARENFENLSGAPALPNNIIRHVYGMVHPGTQTTMRMVAPKALKNTRKPRRDYTKGTGRYQKWWNEGLIKLAMLDLFLMLHARNVAGGKYKNTYKFDQDDVEEVRLVHNLFRAMKKTAPKGLAALQHIFNNPRLQDTYLSLTSRNSVPGTMNAIIDPFMVTSRIFYQLFLQEYKMDPNFSLPKSAGPRVKNIANTIKTSRYEVLYKPRAITRQLSTQRRTAQRAQRRLVGS